MTAGVKHVHRVRAINPAGVGPRSNYVNPTPPAWGRRKESKDRHPGTAERRQLQAGPRPVGTRTVEMPRRERNDLSPAAFCIRTVKGDPDNTLELQLRELQHHADRNRIDAVRMFCDVRGNRGQFNEMMTEATGENPAFRRILVLELSKLAPASGEF